MPEHADPIRYGMLTGFRVVLPCLFIPQKPVIDSPSMHFKKLLDTDNRTNERLKDYLTVQEKIIIEKQYVGYPPKPVGPSIGLLFNELNHNVSLASRISDKTVATLLLVLLTLLFPLIAALIKLFSTGPVIVKQTCTGYRGLLFKRYRFRTTYHQPDPHVDSDPEKRTFLFGRLLEATRVDELPSVLNILRGEMKLVGPKVRPALTNDYWNNQYSEYYKRFAVEPGLIGISPHYYQNHLTANEVSQLLKKELRYLLTPNLSTELNILAQRFVPLIKPKQITETLRIRNSG